MKVTFSQPRLHFFAHFYVAVPEAGSESMLLQLSNLMISELQKLEFKFGFLIRMRSSICVL